ncbi:hypothetical protein NAI67_13180, partial [Francisella tularensis subsp. holarctica]|nr:hypothetical protein [Francisella tularensis subsp. holarctica]
TINRLEEYTKVQDQKISQLHAMMTQMLQEFAYVLEQQQAQINQLKQAYYYQYYKLTIGATWLTKNYYHLRRRKLYPL